MTILAIGCEYAPVDGWEGIMPAIQAPSNYKKQEAINGYIRKRLAELRDGKAGVDPVVGSIMHAVIIDENQKVVYDGEGPHAGAGALLEFSGRTNKPLIFGLKLHRMLRLMALDLALGTDEVPTKALWAVDLDPHFRYNREFIDPISVLFGSSDVDPAAVARRIGYEGEDIDTALGAAQLALAVGGLLGLGG